MRLSPFERQAIGESVREVLLGAKVYLYGSRTDDSKLGGDLDLLIVGPDPYDLRKKTDVRWKLWERFGEQKIDILLERDGSLSPFARMVMDDAVPLTA